MKPTKEILELIEKRKKYGELANSYDCMVQKWCSNHGVDISDILNDYGCMLTTEPDNYASMTLKRIEEN